MCTQDHMDAATLVRFYYFYESMSIYQAYYSTLRSTSPEKRNTSAALADDKPLMWVPLVFHCTKITKLKEILESGYLAPGPGKTAVSFTEARIDELDRFRERYATGRQVAIGFPRAVLERRGLFQPAYMHHSAPEVKERFREIAQQCPGFLELDDDMGALQEVRVPGNVPIADAVWILSSVRNETTGQIDEPEVNKFVAVVPVAKSFWHRSHQETMLTENVYFKPVFTKELLTGFEGQGQHYFYGSAIEGRLHQLNFPKGGPHPVRFERISIPEGWRGPCTFFQVAEFLQGEIQKHRKAGTTIEFFPRIDFQNPVPTPKAVAEER